MPAFQCLLTLPEAMAGRFEDLEGRKRPDWFATHDPGQPIGSGGGTAYLLEEAWKATGPGLSFEQWLEHRPKLVVHAGGESRRLPAYAATGKALMPISIERGSVGQAFDQNLLDQQVAMMERLFLAAPKSTVLAILSGDVVLRSDLWPRELPAVDVACVGMDVSPEDAVDFGVFFTPFGHHSELEFSLQKPPLEQVRSLAEFHRCTMDAGVWFFSSRAVMALMEACGWSKDTQNFPQGPRRYDLYGDFGKCLGRNPTQRHARISELVAHVVPLEGTFHHFGTNRQMLEAAVGIQAGPPRRDNDLGFRAASTRRFEQVALNSALEEMPSFPGGGKAWIENSFVRAGSSFSGWNLLTNLPELDFPIRLTEGICLDFQPIEEELWCVRPYGVDDPFRGKLGDSATLWLGAPLPQWLADHLGGEKDIQSAELFPVVAAPDLTQERLEWLLNPRDPADWWIHGRRLSARDVQRQANADRLYAMRRQRREASLEATLAHSRASVFFSIDLERAAAELATTEMPWGAHPLSPEARPAERLHDAMFRSELLRLRRDPASEAYEKKAFQVLQEVVVGAEWLKCEPPRSTLQPDQIARCRSPLRMDLAGGWTDTPPYSMMYGGQVVNVAVNLNGQPPVQVFGRVISEPRIVLKSIDLGSQIHLTKFEDLSAEVGAHSEFSLAKTALALSGFTPQFVSQPEASLVRQLEAFGGGIELTMVAAVPKGSGLGTSSILSAAILATLSEVCGHYWNHQQLFDRVTASEQMLTTGGGWQDQAGGVLPGIKLLTSRPGVRQELNTNWLPEQALTGAISAGAALLYYTGVNRLAKDVLKEIVRGMFLNSGPRLAVLREIGENAGNAVEALQTRSYERLGQTIRRSWILNQALDSGTNPPAVAGLVNAVDDLVIGTKLLGAGGGGYMLLLCKDPEAASRVRQALSANPAPAARFVDLSVSQAGLEVSKS